MGEGGWEKRKEGKLWLGCKINKFKIKKRGRNACIQRKLKKTSQGHI